MEAGEGRQTMCAGCIRCTGDGVGLVLWLVDSDGLRTWTARRLQRSGRRMLSRGRRARARLGGRPSLPRLSRIYWLIPLQEALHPRALRRRKRCESVLHYARAAQSCAIRLSAYRLVASFMTEKTNARPVAKHMSHIHAAVSTGEASKFTRALPLPSSALRIERTRK